jgi:hypothetical protein
MKNFVTYLSTAPVIAFAWISFTAGIIEVNRFPDPLVLHFNFTKALIIFISFEV